MNTLLDRFPLFGRKGKSPFCVTERTRSISILQNRHLSVSTLLIIALFSLTSSGVYCLRVRGFDPPFAEVADVLQRN